MTLGKSVNPPSSRAAVRTAQGTSTSLPPPSNFRRLVLGWLAGWLAGKPDYPQKLKVPEGYEKINERFLTFHTLNIFKCFLPDATQINQCVVHILIIFRDLRNRCLESSTNEPPGFSEMRGPYGSVRDLVVLLAFTSGVVRSFLLNVP